jgi:mannonate dehydratase
LLIGRDAHAIEDTWQFLYRSAYWRRGPITMTAIAAVDVALWDLKAQKAGMPLYQLLGGASRSGLLAYGHASGRDLPELFDSIRHHLDLGYRAIRIQTGIPGLTAVYGVASSSVSVPGATGPRYDYEPARRTALPVQEDWDSRAYLRHIPTIFEAVRGEFGPELPLLHDGHHRLTPIQAAKLGKSLEPYDLFWLEDCTPAENQEALRLVRQHTTTPLAIGEVFNTVWDYQLLIREQLIDYVRSAVTHTGGISPLKKILEYAAQYQVKSGMHGPTDISPVGMAAAMHLGLAIHNFGIQEYMQHSDYTNEVFQQSFTFVDGMLHPGNQPGLGVTLDVEAATKFPYQSAYLPFNRLKDGTMHDW